MSLVGAEQAGRNLIFWGAGASKALGMRLTGQNGDFIRHLAGGGRVPMPPLSGRVATALGGDSAKKPYGPEFQAALEDLLTILNDASDSAEAAANFAILPAARAAMARHWAEPAGIDGRIHQLRALYDWPALRMVIQICPGSGGDEFILTDLFNILDMHIASGHGFNAAGGQFLSPQRVISARATLQMLLQAMFFIDYQQAREREGDWYRLYYDFAREIGLRAQRQGIALAATKGLGTRDFYQCDTGFISLNYDPLGLWAQFKANKDLNDDRGGPHVGDPPQPLRIFHDLGHFMAVRTIGETKDGDKPVKERLWYPLNESSAQRLNDTDHVSGRRVRLTKYLFPHGSLCWRECPNCGKLTSYFGDRWADAAGGTGSYFGPALIPPPPLRGFVQVAAGIMPGNPWGGEAAEWSKGAVDARACVHCETLTYTHHAPIIMQTNLKRPPPPFIEEIQRELRVSVQTASHIILMGYSLPPDDVTFRAFFAARKHRASANDSADASKGVRCTVVTHGLDARWIYPDELAAIMEGLKRNPDRNDRPPYTTLKAAIDLFGRDNVRCYGSGAPDVFLDGGRVSRARVDRLLDWEDGNPAA